MWQRNPRPCPSALPAPVVRFSPPRGLAVCALGNLLLLAALPAGRVESALGNLLLLAALPAGRVESALGNLRLLVTVPAGQAQPPASPEPSTLSASPSHNLFFPAPAADVARKSRYAPLAALVPRVGAGALLAIQPYLIPRALAAMEDHTVCSSVAGALGALWGTLRAECEAAGELGGWWVWGRGLGFRGAEVVVCTCWAGPL